MVHGTPWRLRCGILLAFTLLCAHSPLQAQSLFGSMDGLFGSSEPTAAATAPAPIVTGALVGNQQRTRFVIGLPKTTQFEVFSLSNPNRVVVQVAETRLRLPEQPKSAPVGLIKSFQAGLSGSDRSRIIIYVTEPVIVSSARIEKTKDGRTQHLIVEIAPFVPMTASIAAPVKQKVATAMVPPPFTLGGPGLQPPLPRPAVSPDVLARRAFKPVIVIDPGHGGHDSGAEKNGAVEKDIVLAFSKTLAKKLNATGRFKVLLTREEDVFIPLGDRIAFGEKHQANLFIAVHCDYADTGSAANGATIYSLRDSVADSLRRSTRGDVAGKVLSQNEVEQVKQASEGEDVSLVKGILADLAEREVDATRDRTSVFARTVIETMGASTAMRNDPDQQAGFRVLKTAQFPSVLIELAYVTNKQDAENLQSDTWRDKVANSILSAVDNYFSNQLAQLPM
jgi:N-acetylmuramoyl-L-alanine amidase